MNWARMAATKISACFTISIECNGDKVSMGDLGKKLTK